MNQDLLEKKLKRILFGNSNDDLVKVLTRCIEEEFSNQYSFVFEIEDTDSEILRIAKSHDFDIFILVLNNIMFESGNAPAEERVGKKALQLVTYLVQTYKKPVIGLYGWPDDPSYPDRVLKAGASFVFQLPMDMKDFLKTVKKCLN